MNAGSTDAVHIDDLARPRLPWPLRVANGLGGPIARDALSLAPDDLLEVARKREGHADFGDAGFREPLDVFAASLERDAGLNALGRFAARELIVGLLRTRLRLARLLTEHPEIEQIPVEAPIVVVGLPRTGTTHLHSMLAADARFRSLPYWESLEPLPQEIPAKRPAPGPATDDPRHARCRRALRLLHWAAPLFPRMHEMTPDAPHEEVQLLAVSLSTMLFEASNFVPGYRDWYVAHDQTFAYRTLKQLLQALSWLDGAPRRFVLKSPQHLEQLVSLLHVFPDAKLVQTHRDAVRVTASFCTMAAYGLRMSRSRIDLDAVGGYWAARIEQLLRASIDARERIAPGRIRDLRFHDFMADELGAVRDVYAFADVPFDRAAETAIAAYRDANPRGRHGTIDYRLEDFGLDPAERRAALGFYAARFGLADL